MKTNLRFSASIFIVLFCISAKSQATNIIHVKGTAFGMNDGTSWEDAFTKLEDAIAIASNGDQIWVATGTYTAPANGYTMKDGIAIYGGFAGKEISANQRSLADYPTILNGGGGRVITNTTTLTNLSILDGFTLQGGIAGSTNGGAIYNQNASPTLQNLIIKNNSATGGYGGGIYNNASSPTLINVIITNNSATNGAGIYAANNSQPTLINATIAYNKASNYGGGVYCIGTSPVLLQNCIIWYNFAQGSKGRQFFIDGSTVELHYCCYGNSTNAISLKTTGTIIASDNCFCNSPIFSDSTLYDLRLQPTSPCIDKGNNTYNASLYDNRGYGYGRAANSTIDIGAFEYIASLNILYVKQDATGNNTGTGWMDAFTKLEDAISASSPGHQIWVANGIYNAPPSGYAPIDGIAIYGGFAGNETATFTLDKRDFSANTTILQGSGGQVAHNNNLSSSTILDGFTVQNGNSGTGYGGGIYNNSSSPKLQNLIIRNNTANDKYGGGIYNRAGSSPVISNVVICNNSAAKGGGIYNTDSSLPILQNVTIANNTASSMGGGIYNNTDCDLTNCILWGNTATDGQQLYIAYGTTNLSNCCCADYYCKSAGIINLTNAITDNPLFINQTSGDFRLLAASPCIDTGKDISISTYDVRGYNNSRKLDKNTGATGTIDVGAYEYNVLLSRFYVKADATGAKNGTCWTDAYTSLQDALDVATAGSQIWVAAGTYYPTKIPASITGASGDRYKTFQLKNGVTVYGGFTGNETTDCDLNTRHIKRNATILSGDIGTADDYSDNCYHVVNNFGTTLDASSILDGFTITNGNADNASDSFRSSCGGGILNMGTTPILRNLFISGNLAINGGGIFLEQFPSELTNCVIVKNTATTGGGVYLSGTSTSRFTNLTIAHNQAVSGGGIANFSGCTLTNCILPGNGNNSGRQLYTGSAGATSIDYCAFPNNNSDNDFFTESGGSFTAGTHNIELYQRSPNFKEPGKNNYELLLISPCLGNGDANAIATATDAKGSPRKYGSSIDRGAYQKWDGLTAAGSLFLQWNSTKKYSTSQLNTIGSTSAGKDTLEILINGNSTVNLNAINTLKAKWIELTDSLSSIAPVMRNGSLQADTALYVCTFPKTLSGKSVWSFFGIPFKSYLSQIDGAKIENTVRVNKYEESIRAAKGATKSAWIHMDSPFSTTDINSDSVTNDYLEAGRGYALLFNTKVPDTSIGRTVIFPSACITTFSDTDQTKSLSWTAGNNCWVDQGWNLIANPFTQPAAIVASASTWPYGTGNDVKNYAGGAYFYHSDGDYYDVIPLSILNSNGNGLSPFGACFVKTDGLHSPEQIQLTPFSTTTQPLRSPAFTDDSSETPDLIQLQLADSIHTAKAYILFHSSAHNEVVPIEDSPALSSTTSGTLPVLATMPADYSMALLINSLPFDQNQIEVPLQAYIPGAGSFNLSINQSNNNITTYLIAADEIRHNLTCEPFIITASGSQTINYRLLFEKTDLSTNAGLTSKEQHISVYTRDNTVLFDSNQPFEEIILFDISGNRIRSDTPKSNHFEIELTTLGVYIIKAITTAGCTTKKVIIN